eukprot:COSAG06_NODE_40686_length_399_cov_1.430000_1_plen_50_part_10
MAISSIAKKGHEWSVGTCGKIERAKYSPIRAKGSGSPPAAGRPPPAAGRR